MAVSKTDPVQLIAFLEDEKDAVLVEEVLKRENLKNYEVIKGGIKEALEAFSHQRSSQYLIIDVSKSELPVSDLNKLAEVCEPGINVIAVGTRNDVGLYRDLMKLGIFEYIVTPLFPEILGRALRNMVHGEEKEKKTQSKLGKIVAVAGARGGVGSSFIAVNFASILSGEKTRRVVLVDLDFHFGTVSLYSNVKTNFGLRNALEDPDRLDPIFLERLLESVSERFSVLSTEEPLEEPIKFKVEGVGRLLTYLSKLFHYVVVDVPHDCNEFTNHVIESAHFMLLVADPTLAALRDTGRLIHQFGQEEVDHRLILILSKYEKDEKNNLNPSYFEETLKRKINHIIPYDASIPIKLTNQGKTLVDEKNPLAEAIRGIVDDVQGILLKPEKQESGFGKFFQWLKFK